MEHENAILLCLELWNILGSSNTTPPTGIEVAKGWKVKGGKVMFFLNITIKDEFLQSIKNAKTPKEA